MRDFRGRMMSGLSDKQERFCQEYLIDLNATQAAIRSGYSRRTANRIATENLSKPVIADRIANLNAERLCRVRVDADYVLNRLIEIDQMDVADILDKDGCILPVMAWPAAWRRTLSTMDVLEFWEGTGRERRLTGLLKKVKWPDKLRNLELIGKHTTVGAFKETVDHNHKSEIRSINRTIVDPKKEERRR